MTSIEHRVEAASVQPNYSGHTFTDEQVAAGEHRRFVGGVWDTHGERQLNYLVKQGLQPEHRLLDVGCGCFRAGRHFIDYLEPAHYYGIDANLPLLQSGYDVELTDEQRSRLPITNLRANDRFDGDFGVQFDYALAQSVFTHVSLNHVRLCLYRTAKVMRPGGSFYATFFEHPAGTPIDTIFSEHKPKPYYHEKNVFWYYRTDFKWAANVGPWKYRYIGNWGHPSGQKMVQFIRMTDEEIANRDAAKETKPGAAKTATPTAGLAAEVRTFARRGRKWAARRLDPPKR